MRSTAFAGTWLAVLALAAGASAAPAPTSDDQPCGAASQRAAGGPITTQYCPIWVPGRLGHVPVVTLPDQDQVGRLLQGGSANWFLCQARGPSATEGDYHNVWWALTLSDDNTRGWVSEVYFRGGG